MEVDGNENLAYFILRKYFPLYANDDDYRQEALIGLWNACRCYDPSKGNFSALATRCINNEVLKYQRLHRQKIATTSMDADVKNADDVRLEEIISHWDVGYSDLSFLDDLNDANRRVLILKASGYTQREIADKMGVSANRIYQRMEDIKEKIRRREEINASIEFV